MQFTPIANRRMASIQFRRCRCIKQRFHRRDYVRGVPTREPPWTDSERSACDTCLANVSRAKTAATAAHMRERGARGDARKAAAANAAMPNATYAQFPAAIHAWPDAVSSPSVVQRAADGPGACAGSSGSARSDSPRVNGAQNLIAAEIAAHEERVHAGDIATDQRIAHARAEHLPAPSGSRRNTTSHSTICRQS